MESPIAVFRRLTHVPQGIIVVISAFLPIFAIVSMFPALPSLIGHFKDYPNAGELVPWMVTAPALGIALLAPFAGYLVDRFGRIRLLIWATFFYGFLGTAPFFLDDLPLIFATRVLLGVCEASILTVVNTLIGDYWDDNERRDWLYLQGLAGPVMGALVIRGAGPVTELRWNGVFLIYSVAFVIFGLMKLFLYEPKRPGSSTTATPATQPAGPFPLGPMLLVALVTLFASLIYYVYMVKGALMFNAVGVTSPARISELAATPALMVLVGAVLFRSLGDQPNGIQLGAFFLLLGIGLVVMGMATTVSQVVTGIVIQQVGIGMSIPALIAWAQTKLAFEHRGRGMGIWASSFFLGQFLSPWCSARAEAATGSINGAFVLAGVASLAAAVVGFGWWIFNRSPARASNPA